MGTSGTFYEDPGGDYFTRLNPERARTRAIRQLESLGYAVTLAGVFLTPATHTGLTPMPKQGLTWVNLRVRGGVVAPCSRWSG